MEQAEWLRLQKCYEEGCDAFYNGEDYDSCPYPPGTPESRKWQAGWSDSEVDS